MEDIVTENAQEVERVENEKKFVPFFKCSSNQIIFEFLYLLLFVIISGITLFLVQIGSCTFINYSTKVYLFSVIGGALGGWANGFIVLLVGGKMGNILGDGNQLSFTGEY